MYKNSMWFAISFAAVTMLCVIISGCGDDTAPCLVPVVDAGSDVSRDARSTPNGSQCVNHAECASGYCPNSICADKLKNNNTCHVASECISNFCHPDMNVCVDKPRALTLNEACEQHWQCESWFCNDKHVCDSPKSSGTACSDNSGCASGHCVTFSNGTSSCS